ncbi:MAG: ATP-binding protein [Erysipelotrichaceae bacterium]|nr:ATP-binding protein [Erysipelotrichaceae bacterium]
MLNENFEVVNQDYHNMGKVSSQIKKMLMQIGFDPKVLRRIAVASYEAEINMVIHAYGGNINLHVDDEGIITLIFHDVGPGIADLEKAMTPGWSTASEQARNLGFGAGMGLVNIKRVADTFDIKTSPQGTILTLTFNGY